MFSDFFYRYFYFRNSIHADFIESPLQSYMDKVSSYIIKPCIRPSYSFNACKVNIIRYQKRKRMPVFNHFNTGAWLLY